MEKPIINPVLSICPVCKHDLHVEKLVCSHCHSSINGHFTLSKFNYLEAEKLYFIEVFVKNRGNIKAIEKELNISYPTVKKMLDDVIVKLGYQLDESKDEPVEEMETNNTLKRINIFKKLSKKEISVEEAVRLLKDSK